MTSCNQGLSPNNNGRQWRESLGTRLGPNSNRAVDHTKHCLSATNISAQHFCYVYFLFFFSNLDVSLDKFLRKQH